MAFWNDAAADPKRKYRFLIRLFGDNEQESIAWYVKSVSAPSFEITSVEHHFSDHVFNFPGKIKWSDVEVTLVDPAGGDDVVFKTLSLIKNSGYSIPNLSQDEKDIFKTFSKNTLVKNNGNVSIETQDGNGDTIEIWTLNNAFITNVKFGDFDYASEDLRDISISLKYDWASCEYPGSGETGSPSGTFFTKGPNNG